MDNQALSQLGVLGTGGMGGALYAASSSLASIDNEIMNMELKLQASGAKTGAEITKIRLDTQVDAASQTEEATKTQASEDFATAGASLVGCAFGIGFGIKDFSGKSLDDEIADTKSFRDAISPKAVKEFNDKENTFKTKEAEIKQECNDKIKEAEKECSTETEEAEIEAMTFNHITTVDTSDPNFDSGLDTKAAAIRAKFNTLRAQFPQVKAKLESDAKTEIQKIRTTTFGSPDVVLQAGRTAPTPEEQVIDRWVGNDLRAPDVSGFKGHDENEAKLNQRAAELLKADQNKLRIVRHALENKLTELQGRKDSINANQMQQKTTMVDSGMKAVGQGVGGYYKTKGAKDSYASSVENATAQSIEMAEKAFQDGVRNYEQAAEQLRQAAIQIAQGYQQAARG